MFRAGNCARSVKSETRVTGEVRPLKSDVVKIKPAVPSVTIIIYVLQL